VGAKRTDLYCVWHDAELRHRVEGQEVVVEWLARSRIDCAIPVRKVVRAAAPSSKAGISTVVLALLVRRTVALDDRGSVPSLGT
jgi:hypothetical protein